MMLRMRSLSFAASAALAGSLYALAACSSAAPSVEQMAAREFAAASNQEDEAEAVRIAVEARAQLETGEFDDAIDEARDALDLDPRNARARAVLAAAILGGSNDETPPPFAVVCEAEGESRSALGLLPKDCFVALVHARIVAASGHLSAALAAAEACLQQAVPDASAERAQLAAAAADWAFELGEDRRAIARLREHLDFDPNDARAHHRLGSCLLRIAQEPADVLAASKAFSHCAELDPKDLDAQRAVVVSLLRASELAAKKGDAAAVSSALTDALAAAVALEQRFPMSIDGPHLQGVVCHRQREFAKAVECYQRALAIDQEHLPTLLAMIDLALLSNDASNEALPKGTLAPGEWIRRALGADANNGGLDEKERGTLRALEATWK
jgi:tetratricopeptide (TPR) repeat protein